MNYISPLDEYQPEYHETRGGYIPRIKNKTMNKKSELKDLQIKVKTVYLFIHGYEMPDSSFKAWASTVEDCKSRLKYWKDTYNIIY